MDSGLRLECQLLHLPVGLTTMRSGVGKPLMVLVVLTLSHSSTSEFPKLQAFPHPHKASFHLYYNLYNISKSIYSLTLNFKK